MSAVATVIAWLAMLAFAAYLVAVGTGLLGLGRVQGRHQARLSRLVMGGSGAICGLIFFLAGNGPVRFLAASVIAAGLIVIATASRRAAADPVTRVPDIDLVGVARGYRFESRPPARGTIEIHARRGWTVFMAITGPGFAVLLVGFAWQQATRDDMPPWAKLALITGVGAVFLGLLIVPALLWTLRAARGRPFLTIGPDGIVLGDARHDPMLEWDEIARLEARLATSNGFTDRVLIVHPRRADWLAHQRWTWRVGGAISNALYGGPIALSTMVLAMPFDEVVARIVAHRPDLVRVPDAARADD